MTDTNTSATTKTLTYTEQQRIWRVQGDIQNGDISTLTLEAFWVSVWLDTSGNVINTIPGGVINLGAVSSGVQEEFIAIQEKLAAQINAVENQTSSASPSPT